MTRASPTVCDQDTLKSLRCTSSPGCDLKPRRILKNLALKERRHLRCLRPSRPGPRSRLRRDDRARDHQIAAWRALSLAASLAVVQKASIDMPGRVTDCSAAVLAVHCDQCAAARRARPVFGFGMKHTCPAVAVHRPRQSDGGSRRCVSGAWPSTTRCWVTAAQGSADSSASSPNACRCIRRRLPPFNPFTCTSKS